MSDSLKKNTDIIKDFIRDRDWEQFHSLKDTAISLSLEAAELLEHFQWKTDLEIAEYLKVDRDKVGEELADVLYWALLVAKDTGVDLGVAFDKKMIKNAHKYPVEKARGKHTKYDKL